MKKYLDRDDELTTILKEILAVMGDNSGLVPLSDISEDTIDHRNKHSVFEGLSGITNNRDNICSLLSHGNQVSAGSVGEFNSIYNTFLGKIRRIR